MVRGKAAVKDDSSHTPCPTAASLALSSPSSSLNDNSPSASYYSYVYTSSSTSSSTSLPRTATATVPTSTCNAPSTLKITQQPPRQVVYQRILRPNPVVTVSNPPPETLCSNLFVEASLARSPSSKVYRASEIKETEKDDSDIQNTLQGVKIVRVIHSTSSATFKKLKILSTSQKLFTYFRLRFVLKQYVGNNLFIPFPSSVVYSDPIESFSHTIYLYPSPQFSIVSGSGPASESESGSEARSSPLSSKQTGVAPPSSTKSSFSTTQHCTVETTSSSLPFSLPVQIPDPGERLSFLSLDSFHRYPDTSSSKTPPSPIESLTPLVAPVRINNQPTIFSIPGSTSFAQHHPTFANLFTTLSSTTPFSSQSSSPSWFLSSPSTTSSLNQQPASHPVRQYPSASQPQPQQAKENADSKESQKGPSEGEEVRPSPPSRETETAEILTSMSGD